MIKVLRFISEDFFVWLVQISVYRSDRENALFLFRQEKGQKKPSKGALRANRAPFTNPRRIAGNCSKVGQLQSETLENLSQVRTGGVHRGGCLRVREHASKRLPYAAFFGYFLVRIQESNTYHSRSISSINRNLTAEGVLPSRWEVTTGGVPITHCQRELPAKLQVQLLRRIA